MLLTGMPNEIASTSLRPRGRERGKTRAIVMTVPRAGEIVEFYVKIYSRQGYILVYFDSVIALKNSFEHVCCFAPRVFSEKIYRNMPYCVKSRQLLNLGETRYLWRGNLNDWNRLRIPRALKADTPSNPI